MLIIEMPQCIFALLSRIMPAVVCAQACLKNWVVLGGMNIHDHALCTKKCHLHATCKQEFYNELYRGI